MVKFGCKTVAEAMPLAEKAAEEVSKIFPRPIKLEFEKVSTSLVVVNMVRWVPSAKPSICSCNVDTMYHGM